MHSSQLVLVEIEKIHDTLLQSQREVVVLGNLERHELRDVWKKRDTGIFNFRFRYEEKIIFCCKTTTTPQMREYVTS